MEVNRNHLKCRKYITQEMGMGEVNSYIHRTTTSTAISTKDLRP